MKCTRCDNDVKLRERSHGDCPNCGQRFAFEPQKKDPFTDVAFKAAIDKVSANGAVRFAPTHVRYELARRLGRRPSGTLAVVFGLANAGFIGFLLRDFALVLPACFLTLGVSIWLWRAIGSRTRPSSPIAALSNEDFRDLWRRWLAAHGDPPGLIQRRPAASPRALPSDIEEYSFDRAVICDRAETVDLLLANNFHFENNCALLSVNGYPQHAFETVRAMLKRNSKLTVYVLHDASYDGCLMAQRIARAPEWFPEAVVIDVGLRPAQCAPFWGLFESSHPFVGESPALTGAERAWLDNYMLELACIPPEQLIKRLFAALIKPVDLNAAGMARGDGYYVDQHTLGKQAVASDGGGDSFG